MLRLFCSRGVRLKRLRPSVTGSINHKTRDGRMFLAQVRGDAARTRANVQEANDSTSTSFKADIFSKRDWSGKMTKGGESRDKLSPAEGLQIVCYTRIGMGKGLYGRNKLPMKKPSGIEDGP